MIGQVTSAVDRVRAYIAENFLYARPDIRLGLDDSLLESGVIDSMGIIELVQFLEEEFQIRVGEQDITEDNFNTLRSIERYVQTCLKSDAPWH